MSGQFWVYVNEPNDKAFVHRADCSHCKNGQGVQNSKLTANGKWIGPLAQEIAIRTAKATQKKNTRWCGHCARQLNIQPEF